MLGMADIHCIPKIDGIGASVWLEIKAPGKKQTPNQKSFEAKVKKAGGYYFVITSIEECIAALESLSPRVLDSPSGNAALLD